MSIPEKYDVGGVEKKWLAAWEKAGRYHYVSGKPRAETYVVDTPPPTVSGSLHIGHVFSYTQTDVLARYQRMNGKNVFYPMGWDDNGLPTERRVQNLFNITCDPALPYDPSWKAVAAAKEERKKTPVSRRNFLEACSTQTADDEKRYEELWRGMGLSIDWRQQYATIDENCRRTSQLSFLDLMKKGLVYNTEAPTLWDTGFQTAVAQAEVEERPKQGAYHDLKFTVEGGGEFVISTTRPELLPACIAVVAHPDDERFKKLFGRFAFSPLYGARVPILPAEHADPEKGTGILMICTFGDVHDVEYWKKSKLPLRQIIGRDGRFKRIRFEAAGLFASSTPDEANKIYEQVAGLYVNQARAKTVELLRAASVLMNEPKPTEQAVKFYEKGDQPLEYISTRQWFVRILDHKEKLLEQGRKIAWHPEYMVKRYEQWVTGLNQDWCISRQRYFGVPFPVWYPIDAHGVTQYDTPIFAAASARLPLDPMTDAPSGFREDQRGVAGGFAGDPDVMDTWATSSVTPQINSHWEGAQPGDAARHAELFPADLRPQAHEIIRTWAFYTITKSWMHEGKIPWKNIAISGWVVDPNREKMSKSKGNIVTPQALLEKYSADAVRYWAGRAKLGQDTIYDETVFGTGKRLATKMFNASRFVMLQLEQARAGGAKWTIADVTTPVDRAWLEIMRTLITDSTRHFEAYDYAQSLIETEQRFWDFCDNYLELVKARAYQMRDKPEGLSAIATLEWTLQVFLRLLAPFMPYVTEEVWSWSFAAASGRSVSVHTAVWPSAGELDSSLAGGAAVYETAAGVLNKIRAAKSTAQKSLKWPVSVLTLRGPAERLALLDLVRTDVLEAGQVVELRVSTDAAATELAVDVELSPVAAAAPSA